MLEPHLAKRTGEKFKHKITAQFRGISPIWTLSLCARDVGGMWMSPTLYINRRSVGREKLNKKFLLIKVIT